MYLYFFVSFLSFAARNNYHTRHLAKILIHMAWCLQESISTSSGAPSLVYVKAVNAVYISSVFLKYFIENEKEDKIEDLYLSVDESEPIPTDITKGNSHIWYISLANDINPGMSSLKTLLLFSYDIFS